MFTVDNAINSLAPGKFEWNWRKVIFKLISVIDGWGISCKIALRWMPLDLTDDKSILVQVMAWCHQATSHYLSQCWLRSLSPYGVTRPQWVKQPKNTLWWSISKKNLLKSYQPDICINLYHTPFQVHKLNRSRINLPQDPIRNTNWVDASRSRWTDPSRRRPISTSCRTRTRNGRLMATIRCPYR